MSKARDDLSWLLNTFVRDTPGVVVAQTMSSDGMHLAASGNINQVQCDQFAAVTSGLASLGESATEIFGHQDVVRQIIETDSGWILVTKVSPLASLAVVTDSSADLGLVGYELALLVERSGEFMSPAAIREIQNLLIV